MEKIYVSIQILIIVANVLMPLLLSAFSIATCFFYALYLKTNDLKYKEVSDAFYEEQKLYTKKAKEKIIEIIKNKVNI